jgi:hypothetical protein
VKRQCHNVTNVTAPGCADFQRQSSALQRQPCASQRQLQFLFASICVNLRRSCAVTQRQCDRSASPKSIQLERLCQSQLVYAPMLRRSMLLYPPSRLPLYSATMLPVFDDVRRHNQSDLTLAALSVSSVTLTALPIGTNFLWLTSTLYLALLLIYFVSRCAAVGQGCIINPCRNNLRRYHSR